jgi:heme-degrading monooxygenase HmoA
MVTIGMNYTVLPGKEGVFERAFEQVLSVMKEMDGHTESHLYRDVGSAQSYLIVSEWSDKAQFDAFTKSEQFARVTNWGKEQILAGRPSHRVY